MSESQGRDLKPPEDVDPITRIKKNKDSESYDGAPWSTWQYSLSTTSPVAIRFPVLTPGFAPAAAFPLVVAKLSGGSRPRSPTLSECRKWIGRDSLVRKTL